MLSVLSCRHISAKDIEVVGDLESDSGDETVDSSESSSDDDDDQTAAMFSATTSSVSYRNSTLLLETCL